MFGPVILPGPDGVTGATTLRPDHLQFSDWHFYTMATGTFMLPLTCPCCALQAWAWRARLRALQEKR